VAFLRGKSRDDNYTNDGYCLLQTNRVRKEYLKALLRQNIGWYDTVQDKNFVSRITEYVE